MTTTTTLQAQALDQYAAAVDQALSGLAAEHLKPGERIVYAIMTLLALNDTEPTLRAESDLAAWSGLTPHQVRQAVAGLRRRSLVQREWFLLNQRPTAAYRVLAWANPE